MRPAIFRSRCYCCSQAALALWLVYGFLRADAVIIIANAISLALLGGIIFFKIRGPKVIP